MRLPLRPGRRRRAPSGPDAFSAALLEELAAPVIACDAAGEIVLVNRLARELQGADGRYAVYQAPLRRALGGEDVLDEPLEVEPHGGPRRRLSVTARPVLDGAGEVLGAAAVMREAGTDDAVTRLGAELLGSVAGAFSLVRSADGTIVYVNDAWERMFGYRASEVVGGHLSAIDATGGQTGSASAEEIVAGLERDGRWQGEVDSARKDGTRFWVAVSVSAFEHPEHGQVWAAVHTDVTARKSGELELREDEARFRAVFEAGPIGLALLDDRGCVLDANEAFSWTTGRARDALVGVHIDDLTHPGDRALDGDLLKALERGELRRYRVVKRFVAESGESVPVALTTSMVRDSGGRALYRVLVAEDPSARAATATW